MSMHSTRGLLCNQCDARNTLLTDHSLFRAQPWHAWQHAWTRQSRDKTPTAHDHTTCHYALMHPQVQRVNACTTHDTITLVTIATWQHCCRQPA